jgi:protein ImuB
VLEKQRVLVCNAAATALGIKPGMGTATARALADSILLLERDPDAEQRRLQQLCCWGYSISPTLYPYRDNCLLLEIGSCLRLYGDVEALLERVESGLSRRGVHYRTGLGPTPKSAWLFIEPLAANAFDSGPEALDDRPVSEPSIGLLEASVSESSWEAPDHSLVSDSRESTSQYTRQGAPGATEDTLEARLAPLPLKLLEDFPRQVDALAKAGLWTFGDILALPRQALARRCGREFVHHLEQVLGTEEDRQPSFEPPRSFNDDYWFGYEVKANQELLPAIELLLKSFCHFLRNTQLETRQVEWLLYGINRKIYRFDLCSSQPQTHWQAWYQLTRLKVEQLELDHSIEGVGLVSEQLVPGNASSGDLFQQAGQKEPMHSLLDRLKSRLGLQSVSKIACRDEHLPEFAGYCSLDTRPGAVAAENGELRPFWLIQEPQLLQVFNGQPCWQGRLELLDGPERIEDNWWEQPVSRDYYVARDDKGLQYWVYRDRLCNQWYMQGVFL